MSTIPVPENIDDLKAQVERTIEQGKGQPFDDIKLSVYGCLYRYAMQHHSFGDQAQELAERIAGPITKQYLTGCPKFVPISASSGTASRFIHLDGVPVLVNEKYITDEVKAAIERINNSLASNTQSATPVKPIVIAGNDTVH